MASLSAAICVARWGNIRAGAKKSGPTVDYPRPRIKIRMD
jgi:hypothetical protein